jgi:hypothetical protein
MTEPVDFRTAHSTMQGKEMPMCPACLTTAALAVAGVTSAGGLTTLVVKKLRARTGTQRSNPTTGTKGAQDGSSKNRVAR